METSMSTDVTEVGRNEAAPVVRTIVLTDLHDEGQGGAAVDEGRSHAAPGLLSALRRVRVTVIAHVGSADLTVGELMEARSDAVIRLDRTVEQPIDLMVDGQVVARGVLVAVDDQFAVRITEPPTNLDIAGAAAPGREP
jgi:flagellar motor switch protein FliN/FliY